VLRSLVRLPFLAVRRLRWWRGGWSTASDRGYHEQLYQTQAYDPFSPSYPGYLTIRRFADHVEPLMPTSGTVLDLGCGPGEITCELARRRPHLAFLGIDHSTHAIRRARDHADRLGLRNARFEVGDAEQLPPADRYGLIAMFDAFHHLEHPDAFMAWLKTHTTRCVLIEPAGTWSGRWARGLDVDWLLADLASIRERLEALWADGSHADDATPEPVAVGASTPPPRGEGAVERRYALDDFRRFFGDWHLRITGTIAGIEGYPPDPHGRSPLRALAGDVAYQLVRATEDALLAQDRDGAAKHWVVAATSEADVLVPRLPPTMAAPSMAAPPSRVRSTYGVRYAIHDCPARVAPGAEFHVTVEVENLGWSTWRSDAAAPVHASYHWLAPGGAMIAFDGLRSPLAQPVGPDETGRVRLAVQAPATAGSYLLAIDLVMEGVTWFSEAGAPWTTVPVLVR
jgi:SAM-dependent methyltransferase